MHPCKTRSDRRSRVGVTVLAGSGRSCVSVAVPRRALSPDGSRRDGPAPRVQLRTRRSAAGCRRGAGSDAAHGRRIEVLDVLLVSKDEHGALRFETDTTGIDVVLRTRLGRRCASSSMTTIPMRPSTATLELLSSREIGLDLEALENFAHYLEPDTTTLLLLLEATWAMTLRDAAVAAGGAPIVFACLEPETMLVIGPQLTLAAEARSRSRAAAVAHLVITPDRRGIARGTSSKTRRWHDQNRCRWAQRATRARSSARIAYLRSRPRHIASATTCKASTVPGRSDVPAPPC